MMFTEPKNDPGTILANLLLQSHLQSKSKWICSLKVLLCVAVKIQALILRRIKLYGMFSVC